MLPITCKSLRQNSFRQWSRQTQFSYDKWPCIEESLPVFYLWGSLVSFSNCTHQTSIKPSNLSAKYTVNPSSPVLFRLRPCKPPGMHFSLQPQQHIRSSCSVESGPLQVPSLFKNCCPQHKFSRSAKRTLLSCLIYRYINSFSEWSDLPTGSQWQTLGGTISPKYHTMSLPVDY